MMRVILFVLFLASACNAATISGVVTLSAARTDPPPRYVERSNGHGHDHKTDDAAKEFTAVVVEAIDVAGDVPALVMPDAPQTMAQEGTAFEPNLLVVPTGGVVSFPNHDPIFHNVFSYSSTKTFDLGRYPKGETRKVTFNEPGIVRVFCEIHPSMYAAIIVTQSPWSAIQAAGDSFAFKDLPAGRYRILAADAAGRHSITEVTVAPADNRSLALVLGK